MLARNEIIPTVIVVYVLNIAQVRSGSAARKEPDFLKYCDTMQQQQRQLFIQLSSLKANLHKDAMISQCNELKRNFDVIGTECLKSLLHFELQTKWRLAFTVILWE